MLMQMDKFKGYDDLKRIHVQKMHYSKCKGATVGEIKTKAQLWYIVKSIIFRQPGEVRDIIATLEGR